MREITPFAAICPVSPTKDIFGKTRNGRWLIDFQSVDLSAFVLPDVRVTLIPLISATAVERTSMDVR
jgi:hypothetical protein